MDYCEECGHPRVDHGEECHHLELKLDGLYDTCRCERSWRDIVTQEEDSSDEICYNGNHDSKDGVCVVDGGLKPILSLILN